MSRRKLVFAALAVVSLSLLGVGPAAFGRGGKGGGGGGGGGGSGGARGGGGGPSGGSHPGGGAGRGAGSGGFSGGGSARLGGAPAPSGGAPRGGGGSRGGGGAGIAGPGISIPRNSGGANAGVPRIHTNPSLGGAALGGRSNGGQRESSTPIVGGKSDRGHGAEHGGGPAQVKKHSPPQGGGNTDVGASGRPAPLGRNPATTKIVDTRRHDPDRGGARNLEGQGNDVRPIVGGPPGGDARHRGAPHRGEGGGNFAHVSATARHGQHHAHGRAGNSYFFGNSSPFGQHCQFNNHGHHGNRGVGWGRYGWGAGWNGGWGIGIGIGLPCGVGFGWGYPFGFNNDPWLRWNAGIPCYSYNVVSPWYGYDATVMPFWNDPTVVAVPEDGSLPPEAASEEMPAEAPADDDAPSADGLDYAAIGEQDFRAGEYAQAVKNFRHALVEDPGNGACVLLLAQALFQTGSFEEAAGAVQFATQVLPEDKWNVVGEHRRELYGTNADYVKQLRALENAIREKKDSPSLRFLLGWHYGFNGYPKEAVDQLEKVVALAPKDEIALKVRDYMKKRTADDR